jgi:hypothetical protein
MSFWLLVTLIATAGLVPVSPAPGPQPPAADSLGVLGLPGSAAPAGGDLFAGFS